MKTVPIRKGATFLMYRVKDYLPAGGMGRVFRVHHTGWKVDLAMKQPRKKLFRNQKQKEAFADECKHWIELGLHPHIVSCFYVREINGVPSIFAEWMDGGSLKDWIYSKQDNRKPGRLYDGDDEEVRRQILDISIQFARGLHYAHRHNPEKRLIHQDVKPDNLLLTVDGRAKVLTAKVADFGIANARATIAYDEPDANINFSDGKSITKKDKTYTPSYCSPEQQKGEDLTIRTDIWSWAVSVLEMFVGSRRWNNPYMEGGVIAGRDCEYYFSLARIPIPEAMKDLLRWCFKYNEADRPKDFGVVVTELLEIYQAETGCTYPRPEPKAASLTADSLNNRALSYLDLRMIKEAEGCFEQALKADTNSALSQYNYGIHLWKTARIDDMEAIRRLTSVGIKDFNYHYCLAKLHLARADTESAIECINEAIDIYGEIVELKKILTEAQEMKEKGLDGRCIRTLGKITPNCFFCFSQSGKFALGGWGENFLIWDIETGDCISTIAGDTTHVQSVCFCLDEKQFISGGTDKMIKIWDIEKKKCILTLENDNWTYSTCMSPNKKYLLSGSGSLYANEKNFNVKLWDIETGTCIHTFGFTSFERHSRSVRSVNFSPDGSQALSGSEDRTLRLWKVTTGECMNVLEGHENKITSVCFSPDGQYALSGSVDQTLKLWDIATGMCIRTFTGHSNCVHNVCFSHDGKLAISGSYDCTVKLWEIKTGLCIRTYKKNEYRTLSVGDKGYVCFSSNSKLIISGDYDNKVKVWLNPPIPRHELILSKIQSYDKIIEDAKRMHSIIDKIEQMIFQGDIQSALYQFNKLHEFRTIVSYKKYRETSTKLSSYCISYKLNHHVLRKIPFVFDHIQDFYWEKEGSLNVITRGKDKKIRIWNIATDICLYHTDNYRFCFYSCFIQNGLVGVLNGNLSYKEYFCIFVKDISGSKPSLVRFSSSNKYSIKCDDICSVCFSPDGRQVLFGFDNGTIKICDIETKCVKRCLKGDETCVRSINTSIDGKLLISGFASGKIVIWELATGVCLHSFEDDRTSRIEPVCLSPDNKIVLAAGNSGSYNCDFNIYIWDIETSKLLHILKGHTEEVKSICFSPDGRLAISGGGYTVKLWDVKAGKRIQTIEGVFTDFVEKVKFSPNGQQIVVATENEIHIYDLFYDLHFPGWHDWDEGARPYLEIFLTLYPNWTNDDFNNILIPDLQNKGYGWLRQGGVRAELEKMKLKEKEQHSF